MASMIHNAMLSATPGVNMPELVELGVSSWVPSHFSVANRLTDAPLHGTGYPGLYLNYVNTLFPSAGISAIAGATWLSLERSADLTVGGFSTTQTQTVQFLAFRVGAEYSIPVHLNVHPYISAAIFPSTATTGRTPFDDGSTYFGIPAELTLGSRFPFKSMGIPVEGMGLNLSVTGTLGKVDQSSVSGFGFNGGVNVSL